MKAGMVLALIMGCCGLNGNLAAQESGHSDAGAQAARRLLDEFWIRDVPTRRAAETCYREARGQYPDSARLQFAWTLNRIRFGQYREANLAAASLTETFPDDWDAWHTRIWLQMTVGNINEALTSMQQMAAAVRSAGPLDEATRFRIFSRFGRLYAFAEGPASEKASGTTLAETLLTITDGLDDTDLGSFEDQRAQLVGRYTGMIDEKRETADQQKQQAARAQIEQVQQINAESRSISERLAQIDDEAQAIRERTESGLDQLRSEARPLQSSLAAVDARIIVAQDEAARIVAEIANREFLAFQESDPWLRDAWLRQAAAARLSLAGQNAILIDLRGQYDGIAASLGAIENQMLALRNQGNQRLSDLERESRQLSTRAQKNQRSLARMREPAASTGYLKSVNARLGHLPAFDPFPVEELRQKLLSML